MALSSRALGGPHAPLISDVGGTRVECQPRRASCPCGPSFDTVKGMGELGFSSSVRGGTELYGLPETSASHFVKFSRRDKFALKSSCVVSEFQSEGSPSRAVFRRRSKISPRRFFALNSSDSDTSPTSLGFETKETPSNGSYDYPGSKFEADMTPSGSQKGSSLADQLRANEDEIQTLASPSAIIGKSERSMKNVVERWAPRGSKLNQGQEILERLENVEETDEAVQAALEGLDISVNARDICSIIPSLKWRTALSFFNWLKSHDYEINLVVCNVLLMTFRTGKAWKEADEFAKQMIADGVELDNFTYSIIISCALQCDAPEDALGWFARMREAGVVPDEVTYSNIALVYSRLNRPEEAVEQYERLRETGWKPDKVSFGTMVNVYARSGNYHKASQIIKEMQDAGLEPEAVVYNTLIKYFLSEGKTGQAKRVFQDMEAAGVKPTQYTYSLMIDVHGRAGENKDAFRMFTRLKEDKLPLDVVVYNNLLRMCSELRLVNEAENILAGMVGRGFKPDTSTYKSVISLYAKEGRIKDAEKFANRMVEVGLTLDVVVYSFLMKACGPSKEFTRAEKFFERMLAEGLQPDDKFCGVLLNLFSMCLTQEDRAIVRSCLKRSKPLLSELADLLSAEKLDLRELETQLRTLLSESEADSHRPFCNALTDLCWGNGKKDRAQQFMTLAEYLNVYPDGLRKKTKELWLLNLRGLSFFAAQCALQAWINHLRMEVTQARELAETLVIETGVGRGKDDEARLYSIIRDKLKQIGSPFEPSPERPDRIVASGAATSSWLLSIKVQAPKRPVSA